MLSLEEGGMRSQACAIKHSYNCVLSMLRGGYHAFYDGGGYTLKNTDINMDYVGDLVIPNNFFNLKINI